MSKAILTQNESGADSMAAINSNFTELYDDKISGASFVTVDTTIGTMAVGQGFAGLAVPNTPLEVGGELDDFVGIGIQNTSDGENAYTDIICSADNDNNALTGHYIDMGICGSNLLSSASGNIKTVTLALGGSGYAVGDLLYVDGGNNSAILEVLTLSGSAVATLGVSINGIGYTIANDYSTTARTGVGIGCTVNVTELIDNSLYTANDGYLFVSGGDVLIGTVDAGDTVKIHTGGGGTTNTRIVVTDADTTFSNLIMPQQAAGAPTYVKGAIYFDTSLNKLRVGGATDWETITSA